jgi:microcystin-dependent protein
MATTTRWALRFPVLADSPDVPRDIGNLAADLDAVAMDDQGILSARPGAPFKKGRYYFVIGDADPTQNGRLYRDNGTLWVEVAMVAASVFPVGFISAFAGATGLIPAGWLPCDGAAVARVGAFAALFALLGTTYGIGNGSTTFNVPDLRGRVPFAEDVGTARINANGARGNVSGEDRHTLITSELAAHAHAISDPGHAHSFDASHDIAGGFASAAFAGGGFTNVTNGAGTGISIQNAGGGASHQNMPPYQAIGCYMIKT